MNQRHAYPVLFTLLIALPGLCPGSASAAGFTMPRTPRQALKAAETILRNAGTGDATDQRRNALDFLALLLRSDARDRYLEPREKLEEKLLELRDFIVSRELRFSKP